MNKKSSKLRLFLTGFTMGSADVVPGVSGGTIAFLFGIYEQLIDSIKTVTSKTIKLALAGDIKGAWKSIPFGFLIPLFAGIFTAILTLAKGLEYLLETQPVAIWSFFFGLVVASIYLVSKRIKHWTTNLYLTTVLGSIGAYLLVGIVPTETAATPLMFLLSGAIAICAMILPGVSGSFLLILLGKYDQILSAVNQRDIVTLGLVAIGAVVGLALFSRLLSWLFKHHHDTTVAVLTGFMLGSLRKIWPWKETISTYIDSHGITQPLTQANIMPTNAQEIITSIVLAYIAALLIMALEKKASY